MPGSSKYQDLEERTFRFAANCRDFVRHLPKTIGNENDAKQLIRSSGSVAANYIEANEALGKKDRVMRMRISLKEAKESHLWLRLLQPHNPDQETLRAELQQEAHELRLIFSTILGKLQ
ncbi:MAG: four helix bundle protein [Verrucomicrobiota bacterium]